MLSDQKLADIWRMYVLGWGVPYISERSGVSTRHVQWAIDETRRRAR